MKLGQFHTTVLTDSVGRVSRTGYDGAGNVRWTATPDGRVSLIQHDGLGRTVATIVNYQDGVVGGSEPVDQDLITRMTLDRAGRQLAVTNPAGRTTTFTYDLLDRLTTVTENAVSGMCTLAPCNVVTRYQYDRLGNRRALTDANGNTRGWRYDARNRVIAATDPLGVTTGMSYDRGDRMLAIDDPRGGSTVDRSYGYDNLDRPTRIQTVAASSLTPISMTYDGVGRRVSLVDGTGTTSYLYDALNRTTRVTAPTTGAVNYAYNARGDRTKLTYPGTGAPVIDYLYANDGQLREVRQSGVVLARTNFDSVGRPVQLARSTGGVTTWAYDRADRLRVVDTRKAGTPTDTFSYGVDRLGNRSTVADTQPLSPTISATREKTATFDGQSLTDAATGADAVAGTVTLDTTTPIVGSASARVSAASAYVRENLTASDALYASVLVRIDARPTAASTLVTMLAGTATTANIQLLPSGALRLRVNTTTVGADSAVLALGQVYRIGLQQVRGATSTSGTARAWVVAGDAAFSAPFASSTSVNITTQATQARVGNGGGGAATLSLDEFATDTGGMPLPLSTLSAPTVTGTYGYDGLDRLTTFSDTLGASASYTYDLAGNRTDGGRSYNAANQVNGWSYDAVGNLTSDGTTTFSYDALSRQTGRNTTTYAYNGDGTLVRETTGSTPTNYTQDLLSPLSQILSDGTAQYIYGRERLFALAGGTRTWYASDALGSVRRTFSDVGVPGAPVRYDPWGQVSSGTAPTFGFTGELQRGSSVYLRARWYDAQRGSFASRDTFMGMPERPYSQHDYQYGYSNPLLWTDPSGRVALNGCYPGDPRCNQELATLAAYGLVIDPQQLCDWLPDELVLARTGVEKWIRTAGWSGETLKRIMTLKAPSITLYRGSRPTEYGAAELPLQRIQMFERAFAEKQSMLQITIVHELAHIWDFGLNYALSNGLVKATGGVVGESLLTYCRNAKTKEIIGIYPIVCRNLENGQEIGKIPYYYPGGTTASDYVDETASTTEDWAESVAATVFPNANRYTHIPSGYEKRFKSENRLPNIDLKRSTYVHQMFRRPLESRPYRGLPL